MQVLNLIRPEKSSVKYKVIQFPDGEPHIALKNIDRKDNLSVICRICNPTDLFINYKEVYFTNSYRDWGREVLPNNVKVIEVV